MALRSTAQLPAATQAPYSAGILADLKRIRQAALESDYAYRQTAHLANNIGPRLSGSAQAQSAVEYVSVELKRLGLEVQLEEVRVPHWIRGEETAALTRYPGQVESASQKIVLTALGGSTATPLEGLVGDVLRVASIEELEALGRAKVSGQIVLFDARFDKRLAGQGRGIPAYQQAGVYRRDGPATAARLGAIATLVRSVGGVEYRLPHTGQTNFPPDVPKIPAAAVSAEDADLIGALLREGPVAMRLVLTPQQLPDVVSHNVIADLKGTEHPEQVVIVSGHLDSWDLGTGAIDDAAGVALAMQVANLLQQLHLRPRRTIRVIAWMNEENGQMGSKTYAAKRSAEMANHFAAMESDHGAGHPIGLFVNAKPEVLPLLKPIAKVLQDSGAGVLELSESTGTDIEPLAAAGVPTLCPLQDSRIYFDYHHTAADTLDKIVPAELAENAAVMAVTAYALANFERPLPR
jgi:hypothetical protein